jgi:cytoskeletal protein CcmA (bactofilin family)
MTKRANDKKPVLDDAPRDDENYVNYIGPDNVLEGTFIFNGKTFLERAIVTGTVKTKKPTDKISIASGTQVTANVKGAEVTVAGSMDGEIDADKVTITDGALFTGVITTPRGLTVETGARLSAKMKMKKKRSTKPSKPRAS